MYLEKEIEGKQKGTLGQGAFSYRQNAFSMMRSVVTSSVYHTIDRFAIPVLLVGRI
jgi:hypothetical protein